MSKKKIILIGGGGHCKSCIEVIEETNEYDIVGIIDLPEKVGESILGYPVIGSDAQVLAFKDKADVFLITIGQIGLPQKRREIFNTLKAKGIRFATVVSKKAYVSKHATIGEGTIVMHDALVNAAAVVGDNCIINTKALVEHDAYVGNHCHISTTAVLNGGTRIEDDSFYGSGAVCKEYSVISRGSFIKANSIVK